MPKNLVIVESPAKAKTIEGYLGPDYVVKSSYGHVRDLSAKGLSINIDKDFEPVYEITDDKKKVISELKKLAQEAELVWLASDEDREGEAIAWHLFHTLELADKKTRRIVFNEITKNAITKAINNPRSINQDLVNAQQARRILDRLVGYELSPILWKKVRPSLSAGRVQSVAVRLIVERERERNAFQTQSYFRVTGNFINPDNTKKTFRAELSRRADNEADAMAVIQACKDSQFTVTSVETKPGTRTPAAPFTTSTLQQEASRKLGYSVARTMQLAQKLYESGKITYMRTDSVNLSDFALEAAGNAIHSQFGTNYHQQRKYTTKAKGAQEAHECIRPTDFSVQAAGTDNGEKRLYELIWKRAIASQMSDAKLEKTTITMEAAKGNASPAPEFVAKGEVLKFDGFLKVYLESTDDEENDGGDDQVLPALNRGQNISYADITAIERFTNPPARYTEASLVKKLEELGIGRPSTYAPTISTIQKRGYVVKEEREGTERKYRKIYLAGTSIAEETLTEITGAEKNKLFPTDIGSLVNDFLVEHFSSILDYNFTASVEKQFDDIASGKTEWNRMIRKFYDPFHVVVADTEVNSKKVTGKRLLGVEAASGKNVYALVGRYGPMVQIGETEDEEKPRFASLRKDQSIESISLAEALDLFQLPKTVGTFEDKEMIVGIGRFGPYVKHDNKFVSIPKGIDPLDVSEEQARELILAKREAEKNRIIKTFEWKETVEVLNGRWGPYISVGKNNYKIPKGKKADELTLDEILAIKEEADKNPSPSQKARRAAAEKKAAAKPAAKKKTVKKTTTTAKKTAAKTTAKKSSKPASTSAKKKK